MKGLETTERWVPQKGPQLSRKDFIKAERYHIYFILLLNLHFPGLINRFVGCVCSAHSCEGLM